MHSERIFHADKRVRTPKSQFWTPNRPKFMILVRLTRVGPRGRGGGPKRQFWIPTGRTTGGEEESIHPTRMLTHKGSADREQGRRRAEAVTLPSLPDLR